PGAQLGALLYLKPVAKADALAGHQDQVGVGWKRQIVSGLDRPRDADRAVRIVSEELLVERERLLFLAVGERRRHDRPDPAVIADIVECAAGRQDQVRAEVSPRLIRIAFERLRPFAKADVEQFLFHAVKAVQVMKTVAGAVVADQQGDTFQILSATTLASFAVLLFQRAAELAVADVIGLIARPGDGGRDVVAFAAPDLHPARRLVGAAGRPRGSRRHQSAAGGRRRLSLVVKHIEMVAGPLGDGPI